MTITQSLSTYLQYFRPLREGYWAFRNHSYSAPDVCLTEDHFRLGYRFDLSFLQIPHWLTPDRFLLHQAV